MNGGKGVQFLEGETTLYIFSPEVLKQDALKTMLAGLDHADEIETLRLRSPMGFGDWDAQWEFNAATDILMQRHLPNLTEVTTNYLNLVGFSLRHPGVETLEFSGTQWAYKEGFLDLQLSCLKHLVFNCSSPPIVDLEESLVRCPNVERFWSRKIIPNNMPVTLCLPNCRDFGYTRGDTTDTLCLYLPRVTKVDLMGNFLDELTFMSREEALEIYLSYEDDEVRMTELDLPESEKETSFELSVHFGNIGKINGRNRVLSIDHGPQDDFW